MRAIQENLTKNKLYSQKPNEEKQLKNVFKHKRNRYDKITNDCQIENIIKEKKGRISSLELQFPTQ